MFCSLLGFTNSLYLEVKKIYVWITVLGIACLVLIILLAICGYFIYDNKEKLKSLEAQIEEMKSKKED